MRIAVVTPYFREPLDILERCHASVRAQTVDCTHILVADGHPRAEVDGWSAEHLVLAKSHGDNGNTPRGLGGLSALNRGFDGVAFLDADNWYAPDHLESVIASADGADVVFSDRQVVLSTGEFCPFDDIDIRERRFADTSSIFIRATAPFLVLAWALMDQALSPICDRVMCAAIEARGARTAWSGRRSVFYESRWRSHFAALGKPPPADEHLTDWARMKAQYSAEANKQRLGFDPFAGNSPFDHLRFELVP
ncbi:MAG TPA: glycosyltransferase [Caulobacter sp.]|nr:glycosyltransferase [Caulobacter sp.]